MGMYIGYEIKLACVFDIVKIFPSIEVQTSQWKNWV